MAYKVIPYKQGSQSAKALATALGGRVLRLIGSGYKGKAGDRVINWGSTDTTQGHVYPARLYNVPVLIRNASNKLLFFETVKQVAPTAIPDFWTKKEDIPDEAFPVVCRTILSGHSGAGIVVAGNRDGLVDAPLYVKYIKKKDEYRVHLGKEDDAFGIISVQRKARRPGHENPNWQVRNHANGFIYVRGSVNPPSCVFDVSKAAFAATGLDFGAVDVIYNEHEGRAYALEINTAPGLEGQTVSDYARFFDPGVSATTPPQVAEVV